MAMKDKTVLRSTATIFTKEPTVRIQCQSGSMLITIKDAPANLNGQFSGMVYPKGLAKNSTCLTEYHEQEGPLRYKLPLKSCNTMPIETVSTREAGVYEELVSSTKNEFSRSMIARWVSIIFVRLRLNPHAVVDEALKF
uniref:Uncharacterized protein n=1 Tax=Anopheles stephensi TaxID=30069 RepID=A0A182Y269_ANOST